MSPRTSTIERVAEEAVSSLKLTPFATGGNRLAKGLALLAATEHRSGDQIVRHFALSEAAGTVAAMGLTEERVAEDPTLLGTAVEATIRGVDVAVRQARPVREESDAAEVVSLDALEDEAPVAHERAIRDYTGPPFDETAVHKALIGGLIRAAKLTSRQHEALRLRAYENLKFHEVAARMGVETTSASTSYYQAVKRLQGAAGALKFDRAAVRFFDEFPDNL